MPTSKVNRANIGNELSGRMVMGKTCEESVNIYSNGLIQRFTTQIILWCNLPLSFILWIKSVFLNSLKHLWVKMCFLRTFEP